MNKRKRTLYVWAIFAGAFVALLAVVWYLFHTEPAPHPDYSQNIPQVRLVVRA